jgi:hypothetical protein
MYETYSQRQKRSRGEMPDVYVYNYIPQRLRKQIIYIWDDTLGNECFKPNIYEWYKFILNTIYREHGCLPFNGDPSEELRRYFLGLIDVICFRCY